jgi:ABC-2 type transport system permease protein
MSSQHLVSRKTVFLAVLERDLYVTARDLPFLFLQVLLQPLLLLFVFGRLLTSLGYTNHSYAELFFPGMVSLTAVVTGIQTLAFPLVSEFGWTKEIEDRLLAPMSTRLVAIEKIVFSMIRSLLSAAIMIPVGGLVLGSLPWRWGGSPLFVVALFLGSALGASLGLAIGTLVPPSRINLVFTLALTPLLFTGCAQYPWPSLSRTPWFQALTALNPMTYASEALRAATVPSVPHIEPWICIVVLVLTTLALSVVGTWGFCRRAVA